MSFAPSKIAEPPPSKTSFDFGVSALEKRYFPAAKQNVVPAGFALILA